MIGTSTAEYFFIRICIIFLHNIAPISILYGVQSLIVQFFDLPTYTERIPNAVQIWLAAEAVFFTTVLSTYHLYTLSTIPLSATGLYLQNSEKGCLGTAIRLCQIWRNTSVSG